MQNAKCKRKLQMQKANLKFLSKPRILPKPKIFAKQEFYSPLACKHFRWPQLGRSAKKIIGLTLKCQLKEVPLLSHRPTPTTPTITSQFRIFGGKFKCKMRIAKCEM